MLKAFFLAFQSMRPDNHRRKWDREEFAKLAQERIRKENDEEDAKSAAKKAKVEEEDEEWEGDEALNKLVMDVICKTFTVHSKRLV